ncbi:MAG: chaperonin GroEL [Candidatus Kaiserbacteria bacterium]|nr:chaperonin GroEL [Candidatus Kaiserbacteria bacterium]
MAKQIIFHEDARAKVKKGVDAVAKAVGVTLGPFGRNVVLQKSFGGPTITNDGVSIAKDISLEDAFENIGADIIKEVANKTNELAGDGTSTSVVLAQSMVDEGLKQIDKGVNAMSVRRGMEKAHKMVEEQLAQMKRNIAGDAEVVHIASVSAESEEFGKIIAETVQKVGNKGVVTVEESQSFGIESEVVEGLEIDNGYISPYMMTNPDRLEAEYKDVPVLITSEKISGVKEILPFLEKLTQMGTKDLVIIAEDVEGEALTTFVLNKLRGTFNVLAIKAPGFGDRKKDMLGDIAVTIGAQVISKDAGMSFENIGPEVLGRAARIVAKKDSAIIVGAADVKGAVDERVRSLEATLQETDQSFEKEKVEERIAKLSGGVAVIRVGAATEAEMKYLKLKIEDAVNATKAALEEGVIAGGGAAFVHIAKHLRDQKTSTQWADEYEEKGYSIVIDALEAPLTRIVENAIGDGEGKAVVRKVQDAASKTAGYNALKQSYVDDMFSAGIIDPVKVARGGLQHAVSTVGIFLTTEAAVADIPEKDNGPEIDPTGGMGGMGGMGGGMY